MVLCSSISKAVRRAFSLEGNRSAHLPQPSRRGIYADRTANYTREADASRACPLLQSTEVDHLVRKVENVAKKEVLYECARSLVEKQKECGSLISEGTAYPRLLGIAMVALFMAGCRLCVDQGTKKQELGKLKERN